MTIEEARRELRNAIDLVQANGYEVWGYDDRSINIAGTGPDGHEYTTIDPDNLDDVKPVHRPDLAHKLLQEQRAARLGGLGH